MAVPPFIYHQLLDAFAFKTLYKALRILFFRKRKNSLYINVIFSLSR